MGPRRRPGARVFIILLGVVAQPLFGSFFSARLLPW